MKVDVDHKDGEIYDQNKEIVEYKDKLKQIEKELDKAKKAKGSLGTKSLNSDLDIRSPAQGGDTPVETTRL